MTHSGREALGERPEASPLAQNRRLGGTLGVAVIGLAAVAFIVVLVLSRGSGQRVMVDQVEASLLRPTRVTEIGAGPRSVGVYEGLGAWVDGFDYSPAYSNGAPPLPAAEVEAMAAAGVRTLYLQAARLDDLSPDVLEDRWLLTEFLLRAHQNGMAVVGWYLPKWGDDDADFDHLVAIADFEVFGHRFDGVAVDIEWNEDGLEPAERSRRLVTLSTRIDEHLGADPLAAIVLPPVQTDVINTSYWPDFPWAGIVEQYEVWMPMSYWSFRTEPYGDAYVYNRESTERLRQNLGDPDAIVHGIGGIGGAIDAPPAGVEPYIAQPDQFDGFGRSLADTGSIGGSVYDWLTLDDTAKATLTEVFTTGAAADLAQAPTGGGG